MEASGEIWWLGSVANLDLGLQVLLLFLLAEFFFVVTGGGSGVEGMILGVGGRSSRTQEGLPGVASDKACFSNHQFILFRTSGWPLLLADNLFLLCYLGQSDEISTFIGVP